jgi:hypothetical protein
MKHTCGTTAVEKRDRQGRVVKVCLYLHVGLVIFVFSLSLVSSNEFFLAKFMLACSLVMHWEDPIIKWMNYLCLDSLPVWLFKIHWITVGLTCSYITVEHWLTRISGLCMFGISCWCPTLHSLLRYVILHLMLRRLFLYILMSHKKIRVTAMSEVLDVCKAHVAKCFA